MNKIKALKYFINLTSAYTVCPYCKSENCDVENGMDLMGNELFICTNCNNEMQGIEEHKSADYKAVEWYINKFDLPHGGQSEETIKKAKELYAKRGK